MVTVQRIVTNEPVTKKDKLLELIEFRPQISLNPLISMIIYGIPPPNLDPIYSPKEMICRKYENRDRITIELRVWVELELS